MIVGKILPIWFEEPLASKLVKLREKVRAKRRLTFDCLNAKVLPIGRVACSKGHSFPNIGSSLFSVLKGRSPQICQGCKDYDGEVTE